MQQWTPARHIRAIGAWPTLPARPYLHQPPPHYHNHYAHTVHSSTRPRQSKEHPNITWQPKPHTLPLPPFLLPTNRTNKLQALKSQRRTKSPPPSIHIGSNKRTRTENRRHAPFSTAFAENPYAHALATPVREDRFSDARLPNSCLIDLHLADVTAEAGAGSDGEEGRGIGSGSGSRGDQEISLLPLGMAAELVSKKKKILTPQEREARDAVLADSIPSAPSGSASYVLARRAAIDHITEKPKTRVKGKAVGRRTLMTSGSTKLAWRDDMGEFILDALRRVVVKKLNWFFLNKAVADTPGAVVGMPGGAGRERLDGIDGVVCVLRLKPVGAAGLAGGKSDEKGSRLSGGDARRGASLNQELDAMLGDEEHHNTAHLHESTKFPATDATPASLQSPKNYPAADTSTTQISTETTHESEAELQSTPRPTTPALAHPNKSQTHRLRSGPWAASTHDPSFLSSISIPAPPPGPSHIYFPTLPYRNRRVAAYSLPHLLGKAKTATLLKGSVFADQELVAVTSNVGTVGCQVWLCKLAAYVGERKGEGALV